jgi:hypothetical protein
VHLYQITWAEGSKREKERGEKERRGREGGERRERLV